MLVLAALVAWVVGVVEGRLVACSQVVASRGACTQEGDNTTYIPRTSGYTHLMDLHGNMVVHLDLKRIFKMTKEQV